MKITVNRRFAKFPSQILDGWCPGLVHGVVNGCQRFRSEEWQSRRHDAAALRPCHFIADCVSSVQRHLNSGSTPQNWRNPNFVCGLF